jgi:hypothetical protein
MVTEEYLLIALLLMAAAYVIHRLHIGMREYLKYRGKMLVTCPETKNTAAVDTASARAALAAIFNRKHLELSDCSRWPERGDCPQDCLCQLEEDPESHRVWVIASRWFEGKDCVYCGKPVEKFSHLDRKPALLSPGGNSIEWDQLPPENLLGALSGCLPVCWSCHMVETFRKQHPDLVVDRPWKH